MDRWQDFEVLGVFVGVKSVLGANHLFVQLFTRADANDVMGGARYAGQCNICHIHIWDHFDINLTVEHRINL